VRGQARARGAGGQPAAGGADQDVLHGGGDGATAAEQLALPERELKRFEQLASPRRRQATQSRQVSTHANRLARIGDAGCVSPCAQASADRRHRARHRVLEGGDVVGVLPDPVLPDRVPNAGGVARARVEQVVAVRDQRGDGRIAIGHHGAIDRRPQLRLGEQGGGVK